MRSSRSSTPTRAAPGRVRWLPRGTLLGGSVDHVRHSVLQILLGATGWPVQYPQARFCFWLREQGLLDGVRAAVEASGKNWLHELNNLYVSPVIADALIAADASFAADIKGARQLLARQFPPLTTDISTDQFIESARLALSDGGELPHTIIVLDEVQQYISEAQERSAAITEVAETVQTQFDSRVMLVGAGQSALSAGTPTLMWLRDRFRIAIELTDADVEAVTRKVLLRKKPSAVPAIEQMFEAHAGEVARHLQGTRLGPREEDARDRAADYPLLSTRRRFWEACFQAVDAAGTHSQLRSQLRILHDSLQNVAEEPLGAVIPTGDLFSALAPSLVNTGVLLNEINTRIQTLDDGSGEGRLQHDLCGLVFLIGKLPRQEGLDLGVRADAGTLADLLVADVAADSGAVRHNIAVTLELLASKGTLMKVGDEYRLQTTEGAEWDRTFRERRGALTEVEIGTRRDQLFSRVVQDLVADIKPLHGQAKLRRKLVLHAGGEPPAGNVEVVNVWMRDGWSHARTDVDREARRMGAEDATLHVHLPKKSADLLRDRIIGTEAARQVLDRYGLPASPEGREARESMESRRVVAAQERDAIVRDVLRAATVLQGGGTEIFGEGLGEKPPEGRRGVPDTPFPAFRRWRPWGLGGCRHARAAGIGPAAQGCRLGRRDRRAPGGQGGARRYRRRRTRHSGPQGAQGAALRLAAGRHRRRADRAASGWPSARHPQRAADSRGCARPGRDQGGGVPSRESPPDHQPANCAARVVRETGGQHEEWGGGSSRAGVYRQARRITRVRWRYSAAAARSGSYADRRPEAARRQRTARRAPHPEARAGAVDRGVVRSGGPGSRPHARLGAGRRVSTPRRGLAGGGGG